MVETSPLKTKTTWFPLDCCEWVAYVDFIYFYILNTRIHQEKHGLTRHINVLSLSIYNDVVVIEDNLRVIIVSNLG